MSPSPASLIDRETGYLSHPSGRSGASGRGLAYGATSAWERFSDERTLAGAIVGMGGQTDLHGCRARNGD